MMLYTNVSLVIYHGALMIILRYSFWNLCNISIFELEAVLHDWTPWIQIGLKIALYNSNLFSVDSCDLLPSSQYIFRSWNPNCFRLVNICFFQFSLWVVYVIYTTVSFIIYAYIIYNLYHRIIHQMELISSVIRNRIVITSGAERLVAIRVFKSPRTSIRDVAFPFIAFCGTLATQISDVIPNFHESAERRRIDVLLAYWERCGNFVAFLAL